MTEPYHHGDLRRALLDEAAAVVEAEGVAALSLRDLARRTGVSATAPYHHFSGKAALVTALAEDAMLSLDAGLARADEEAKAGGGGPGERLSALGVTYVLFAVDHPGKFRLAFRPEMGDPFGQVDVGVVPEDVVGFRRLLRVVADLEPNPERRLVTALGAWSHAHGLAALLVDGPLRAIAEERERVIKLAETVLGPP